MAATKKAAPKAAAKKAAAKRDPEKDERSNLLRQAYGAATARLREAHRDEFDRYQVEEARSLGVEYKPRMNPEQKAEKQLAELLEQFPHLRDRLDGNEPNGDEPEDEAEDEAEVKQFSTTG